MNIQKQLYVGSNIYLGPIDHENDPPVISRWSHDPEYQRLVDIKPVYPVIAGHVKKKLEALEKEQDEHNDLFYFMIRSKTENRLIGFASIRRIEWTHGVGWIHMGIGDRQDWRKGYGTEILDLLMEYAFRELNLFRLGAELAEYNLGAKRLFEKAGFIEEVRRRLALNRDGRWWDLLIFGLLCREWEARQTK